MKNSIENKKIQNSLENICSHPFFERSPRSIRLLRYLFDQAQKKINVKENSIGQDLFGKNFDIDNNNGKIRVYMYNLRKKLKDYYKKYGDNDDVIFIIEKGQYNLTYKTKETQRNYSKLKNKLLAPPFSLINKNYLVLFSILSVLILGISIILSNSTPKKYFWNDFFESKDKNLCIVADHYMTIEQQKHNTKWKITQIDGINNDIQLREFSKKNKHITIEPGGFTLLSKMGLFATQDLTKWFYKNNSDLTYKLESKFQYSDIKDKNFIYVGQFKTMNNSKEFFLAKSNYFKVFGDGFKYTNGDIEEKFISIATLSRITDYTMVSYNKMSNGKKALFFTSNHDIGVISTINNFTNSEWLEDFFEKNNLSKKKYFNALFKVTGAKRTEMSCELIQLEVLN